MLKKEKYEIGKVGRKGSRRAKTLGCWGIVPLRG